MGLLLYLGTALVGIPGILLFPAFLPHFLTYVMNKRRIKGKIGAAKVKFQWPVFVTLEVNQVRLTNPAGFEHENFVALKLARGTINVWSLFTKSIKMGTIELEDVDVFVERQKGKGINVSAYIKQVKGEAPLEVQDGSGEDEGVESESESNLVLSLLGMVSEKTDRVAENLSAAVEKEGGLGNFAKNTTSGVLTGTFSKVSNVVGFTSELLSSKAKSLETDVKEAGGIDKWAINTTQTVATAVTDKTKEGISSVKDGGIGGAATFVKDNTTSAVGAVASTANDTLLEEAIHRKVMGCYTEDVQKKYVDLVEVRLTSLHVDARKLVGANDDGNADFKAAEVVLSDRFLEPHPKAQRKDGLPVHELRRRVQVMINYQMRRQNTGAVFRTVTPAWLLPKKGAGAGSYLQGVSTGVSGVLTGVAKKGLSAVGGAGEKLASAGKAGAQTVMSSAGRHAAGKLAVSGDGGTGEREAAGGGERPDEQGPGESGDFDDEGVVLVSSPSEKGALPEGTPNAGEPPLGASGAPHKMATGIQEAGARLKEQAHGAKETVGTILNAGREKAPVAIKGATDLIGGVLGGTGEALTKATGSKHFDDAGKTVAGAFDNVGGALGGLFGGPEKKKSEKP